MTRHSQQVSLSLVGNRELPQFQGLTDVLEDKRFVLCPLPSGFVCCPVGMGPLELTTVF